MSRLMMWQLWISLVDCDFYGSYGLLVVYLRCVLTGTLIQGCLVVFEQLHDFVVACGQLLPCVLGMELPFTTKNIYMFYPGFAPLSHCLKLGVDLQNWLAPVVHGTTTGRRKGSIIMLTAWWLWKLEAPEWLIQDELRAWRASVACYRS
jgi:hypothetical protein